jgi:hypothetical protein
MKKYLLFLVVLGVSSFLLSCAGSNYIPKGSQLIGTYEGSSKRTEAISAIVLVQIYQTPAGDKLFQGTFKTAYMGGALFFRGKLKGMTLEGKFDSNLGNISGQLSSDGSQINGTYNLTEGNRTGTWQSDRENKKDL